MSDFNRTCSILYIGNKLSHHGFTPGVIEELGAQLELCGFKVNYAGTKQNPLLRLIEMIFKTVKSRTSIDYVLIDTYSSSAFWYAYIIGSLCRFLHINYIPILHGGNLPARLDKNPKISNAFFSNANNLVAPSQYLYNEFEARGYLNLKLIPNPIAVEKYKFKYRHEVKPNILWVRSFDATYNCEMAVYVLSKLKERYKNAKLCMVGPDKDGSLQRTKNLAFEHNLSDSVAFTGRLTKEKWHKIAESYDVFINTTNFDNAPLSVIEAMALGLPVVSTNVGGIPYLISDKVDGVLINKGDVNAMTEGIVFLIENPAESAALALAARLRVEALDWKYSKSKWFDILKA